MKNFIGTSVLLIILLPFISCGSVNKTVPRGEDNQGNPASAENVSNAAPSDNEKSAGDNDLLLKEDEKSNSTDQKAEKEKDEPSELLPESSNNQPGEDLNSEEKISSGGKNSGEIIRSAELPETTALSGAGTETGTVESSDTGESGNSGKALSETENQVEISSLPVKEGVGRTSGTGWARKIADAGTSETPEIREAGTESDAENKAGSIQGGPEPGEKDTGVMAAAESAAPGNGIDEESGSDEDSASAEKQEAGTASAGENVKEKESPASEADAGFTSPDASGDSENPDNERQNNKLSEPGDEKKSDAEAAVENSGDKTDRKLTGDSATDNTENKSAEESSAGKPETLSDAADNNESSGKVSENRGNIPVYEDKASEYLNALENEEKNTGSAEESGEGNNNGREYILSFREADNASENAPSGIKSSGEASGRSVNRSSSEKASASGGAENDKKSAETAVAEDRGDDKSREKVVFEDPSHITVVLDGTGWIFLGEKDGKNITFLSRSVDGGKTVFSFRAGSGKVFILNFQFQNTDGSSRDTEIELASRDSEAEEKGSEKTVPADNGDPANEAADLSSGASAVKASENTGAPDSSASDKSAEAEFDEDDINRLFEEALVLMDQKEYVKASSNLEKILNSPFHFSETDRLYFLLGQCCENERDPVKAEMYYSMLLDQFPFSIYYDRAETRKRYLLKYFIDIK